MERIKSILSPGKHVEDEILYGSGGGGQYEHTGREASGSTGGYYGGTGDGTGVGGQSQIYNRERDSIPSQPSTAQEYGKTGDDYLQAEREREAKTNVAREKATREKEAVYGHGEDKAARGEKKNGNGNGHRKQRSGEHKESRNPYTQQAVDPRLGGAEEPKVAGNAQPQAYAAGYSPTQTSKAAQGYEREDAAGRGGKGSAAAAGLGAAGVAGAAGAAGAAGTSRGAAPQASDSPHGEVVGRTVSGNHLVERTASGQYKTRLASIIDPNHGQGVSTPESAYEHTPGGGGAYTADKFHEREPRYASVTMPDGQKYTDPEAREDNGLPSGVGYKAPAGSGYDEGAGRGGASAYERGYEAKRQPEVATTKSEAAHAVSGDQTGHKGAGVVGAGVAGAAAAGAGYEGTKNRKADKAAKKSSSKAGQPSGAKYGDVDVPPGNDYGRGVKDPRYGLPMAAAGVTAEEAAELRRNEAIANQRSLQNEAYGTGPTTANQDYATRPPGASQAQPTAANQAYAQPTTQAEQQSARSSKEERPSRRSSILGFLHLGKDKDKKKSKDEKRLSKDEKRLSKDDQKRLSDPQRQPYADRTGQAPLGSVAGATGGGYGAQQASVAGGTAGHGATADLAYRDRMPSTADAPAFTGGLVAPNGAPLKGPSSAANADSSAWAKSTEREVMDRGGMGQGTQGGGAANQAAYGGAAGGGAANQAAYGGAGGGANKATYGGNGTANQAAYGTGIDESYPNEPTTGTAGTGATQGTAQKSGSQGVATTGGAIAAGAAAGGLAAGGAPGSQANQGVASDYNMQNAQDRGAPADTLYDQVSPRSSAANKKAQAADHTSNGSKETKTTHKSHNHKEKNNTAYAGSDAQTRDAAYDTQVAQGGYGSNAPTAADGAQAGGAAYGGKETQASNAAYGGNAAQSGDPGYGDTAQSSNPGYGNSSGGGTQNPDEAAFGNEDYVGNGNGVSRRGTTKVAERAGHHVLHKDPPSSHPAAAVAGVQ